MKDFYSRLSHPLGLVQEVKHYLTERHVQALWLEQKFFKTLKTSEGLPIHVLSPGIWNQEAGPDFLKAHLKIGSEMYRGDIEIHLSDGGWIAHQHHLDPVYNQVILHISYWPSVKPSSIQTESGRQIPTCYLDDSITLTTEQLIHQFDLEFYPYKRLGARGKCASLFALLPDSQIKALLRSASYWRLEQKAQLLHKQFGDFSKQILGGIAKGLGYKHNGEAFGEILEILWQFRDESNDSLLAIALGISGFLEENRKKEWEGSTFYQHLRLLWWEKRTQITHQMVLKLDHIRPLNHPIRRLAYFTRLIQESFAENLGERLLLIWEQTESIDLLLERLLHLLPRYQDTYWNFHYLFEEKKQIKLLPQLGQDINQHILLNTYLPLLYQSLKSKNDLFQWQRFEALYQALKMPVSSKSRYLAQRFFRDENKHSLLQSAQMGQGAYQIHHDFCTHHEASCEGCPFIKNYHMTIQSHD